MSSKTCIAALLLATVMVIILSAVSKSLEIPYSQLADGAVAYIAIGALLTAMEGGAK